MIRKANKTNQTKKSLSKIIIPFNGRNDAMKFEEDYPSVILEVKISNQTNRT